MHQDDLTQPDDKIAVEGEAFAIEDMGVSNEEKINRLLATAVTVREELHERARKIFIGLVAAAVFITMAIGAAAGVLWGLRDQAETLTDIAKENKTNGTIVRENSEIIRDATDPNSAIAARGRAATAAAVNEIRRSVDCVALYFNGERPDACRDVAARIEAIRAGADPFAPPS